MKKGLPCGGPFSFTIHYHNNMYPINRAVDVLRSDAAAGEDEDILIYDVDDPDAFA